MNLKSVLASFQGQTCYGQFQYFTCSGRSPFVVNLSSRTKGADVNNSSGIVSLLKEFCVRPAEMSEGSDSAAPSLIDSLEDQIDEYCTGLKVSKSTQQKNFLKKVPKQVKLY